MTLLRKKTCVRTSSNKSWLHRLHQATPLKGKSNNETTNQFIYRAREREHKWPQIPSPLQKRKNQANMENVGIRDPQGERILTLLFTESVVMILVAFDYRG
eukprot:scaffold244252_cov15-Tisochrysis_lutea.AAC.1